MATPPRGTKLSLGKLGRATNVGNSNYTSKTSLNSAGRDSGTSKTSLSDFYIGSVDNISSLSVQERNDYLDDFREYLRQYDNKQEWTDKYLEIYNS